MFLCESETCLVDAGVAEVEDVGRGPPYPLVGAECGSVGVVDPALHESIVFWKVGCRRPIEATQEARQSKRCVNRSGVHYILSFLKKDRSGDCKISVLFDHILNTSGTRVWYQITDQVG